MILFLSCRAIGRKCTIITRFRPYVSGELAAYLSKGPLS
jgi:hypothetical protein